MTGCLDENTAAALVQGTLSRETAQEVERHIDGCAACSALLAELARIYAPDDDAGLPQVGGSVGRYRIERRLATGGMGVVFEAHDPELARKVALKLMRPEAAPGQLAEEANARLLREAHAMARLSSPNVVAVFDVGSWRGRVFLAMELVRGVTLSEWLAQQPRSPSEVIDVFCAAGSGLAAAHAAGVVHRDFKPDNVLVADDGSVKVGDFGLTRIDPGAPPSTRAYREAPESYTAEPGLTRTGAALGTLPYMSPEQLFGQRVDALSDQFSFAVALYEALFGTRPFVGTSAEELRWKIAARHVEAPLRRAAPAWQRRVLLRALQPEPAQRYASMQDLCAALQTGARRAPLAHLKINALLQSGLFVLHVVLCAVMAGAVFGGSDPVTQPLSGSAAAGGGPSDIIVYGLVCTIFAVVVWAPLGVVWVPINVYGLLKKRSWARLSSLIYAGLSLLTCVATPYAVYAFVTLGRATTRDVLDG